MDLKDKGSSYWIAVLLVGLALGVVAGLAIAGFAYPIYQSEKWAAWVQAFGSIGAIGVAVFVMSENDKRNRRIKHQNDKESIEAVLKIFLRLCQALIDTIEDPEMYYKHRLESAVIPRLKDEVSRADIISHNYEKSKLTPLSHFCELRANALENARKSLLSIEWSTYPNSTIGFEVVSAASEFEFFIQDLRDYEGENVDIRLEGRAKTIKHIMNRAERTVAEKFSP